MHTRHHRSLRLLAMSLPLLAAASCSDDFMPGVATDPFGGGKMLFDCEIAQDNSTRADESGFADGDRMGVFVVNYRDGSPGQLTLNSNQANNVALTFDYDANKWNAATDIYWLDKTTPADIYGYYPFFNGLSSVTDYSFEVNADQSRPAADGDICSYEASDFLWAKAEKATPGQKVNLTYTHRMAGVKVVLQEGSGFADGQWAKVSKLVTVDNTTRQSSIDLQTGTVTATGSFDRNIVMNDDATGWRAVVVPQTVAAGKTTIGITIDGKPFAYTRDGGMKYTAGKMHTFTIKVDYNEGSGAYSLSLTSEDITDWESDNTSHDFQSNSYFVVNCPEAGKLKECIVATGTDYLTLKNLKVTGQLTDEDFRFMREEMSMLAYVNLKEVKTVDDLIPGNAFNNKETLRRIILPENIVGIGDSAFGNLRLTSALIIPQSVKRIDPWAFSSLHEDGTIELPNSLEYIGDNAFYDCAAHFELKLFNCLKYIGDWAFFCARGATGTFNLPSNLIYLGERAFEGCGHDLTGSIIIPSTIMKVPESAFSNMGFPRGAVLVIEEGVSEIAPYAFLGTSFSNAVTMPESLRIIGEGAFRDSRFHEGKVKLPSKLDYLARSSFSHSNISGSIKFPESMDVVLGGGEDWVGMGGTKYGAFVSTDIDEVILGDNILQVEPYTFCYNLNLCRIEIGKNVSFIGEGTFKGSPKLQQVVCFASDPPKMGADVFGTEEYSGEGAHMDKVVLEVPEASVEKYRNAAGWKEFQNITPHHELAFNIPDICCLDKGVTRTGIIRSEGPWKITECPSWVHVTPDHADYKEELTVKVDPLPAGSEGREGQITFSLNGKDYTTYTTVRQLAYEHKEDIEIVLQTASAGGNEIPVFIVGEGFNAENIVSGDYMRRMNETMEQLMAIEPYKSYRNQFTVTTAVACSPEEGVGDVSAVKVNCFDTDGVSPNKEKLRSYVKRVSSHAGKNMSNALIIMVANYNSFSGWSDIDYDGSSWAAVGLVEDVYPYDQRGLVQHFAGGEAFAGLGNEGVHHFDHIKGCACPGCSDLWKYNDMKSRGYYANLTMSSKMSDAPWHEFIFNPKYSARVDMWEGAYGHLRGVWKSEANSVMDTYIAYYNTISRYAIYKEIMRRAGKSGSLEDFIANDKIEIP